MASRSLNSSIHDAILATFAADSLSLGAHWQYDTDKIVTAFHGKVDRLHAPISQYHAGKAAGEQTHIGQNALQLLEYLADVSPDHRLHVDSYVQYWKSKWDVEPRPGYWDHASKTLLESIKEGKTGADAASTDDDLSHSSKFFPLLAVYHDEEQLAQAVKQLVAIFQSGAHEQLTGEFLARVAHRVLHARQAPSVAIDQVAAQLNDSWLTDRVKTGKASADQSDLAALRSFGGTKQMADFTLYSGLACPVQYGVPAVVHYVHKYEKAEDPTQAIIEDVSVGGNSNGRSMAVALLLFGYRGIQGFKVNELIAGIKAKPQIEQLLTKLQGK
jgi:hypothetical protein